MYQLVLNLLHLKKQLQCRLSYPLWIEHPVFAFSNDLVFAVSQMSDSKGIPHSPARPQAETQMRKYDSDGFTEVHGHPSCKLWYPFPSFGVTSLVCMNTAWRHEYHHGSNEYQLVLLLHGRSTTPFPLHYLQLSLPFLSAVQTTNTSFPPLQLVLQAHLGNMVA